MASFKQTEIGPIPEDWEIVKLRELAKVNEATINNKAKDALVNYIDIASVEERRILDFQTMMLSSAPSRARRIVKDNDILISTVRPNLKHYVFIKKAESETIASTGFAVISSKNIDAHYLYYFITTEEYTEYLTAIASTHTSTYPSFNPNVLEDSEIMLPPPKEQHRIAEILSSLDDKIELNRKMNKTLESIAQAIFKRWFVEFEFPNEKGKPYKSSGGRMVESELGPVPVGWETVVFGKFIDNTISGDWGKDEEDTKFKEAVLCIRGTDIMELQMGQEGNMPLRYIKQKNLRQKRLMPGDMVVEISGGSPTQSTGRCMLVTKEILDRFDLPLICSNFCRVIRLRDQMFSYYIYSYMDLLYKNGELFQWENGTTGIKNLDINSLLNACLIIRPPDDMLRMFMQQMMAFIMLIQSNGAESEKLAQIRDSLLPRLMSGRVRVK